jgi:uncharacterized membrane protein YeaQ/YmgE (transglycosylase-associated protein family)
MTLENVLLWALVGLVAGWLASKVAGGGLGAVGEIVLGIVGAFLGGLVFRTMHIVAPFSGLPGVIFVAFVGAVLLLIVFRVLRRPSWR